MKIWFELVSFYFVLIDFFSLSKFVEVRLMVMTWLWLAVFLTITWNTAQADKQKNIVFQANYEDLITGCWEGSFVLNECEERCECRNGELVNCYRVRKDFIKMDIRERRRFLDAYKIVSMYPSFRKDYKRVVAYHIAYTPTELLHEGPWIFLPWHRWWLVEFENLLRRVDCRVTMPYWNWSRVANHWWRGIGKEDFWSPGVHGLGGDGKTPSLCVVNGPFREDKWSLLTIGGGGCLKRNFSYVHLTGDEEHVRDTLALPLEEFLQFEYILREVYHNEIHWYVGGTMYTTEAANAPEVVPHHSFLDKIWREWQKKGEQYKNVFFYDVPWKFPNSNYHGWQWLDSDNLPDQVKVTYED